MKKIKLDPVSSDTSCPNVGTPLPVTSESERVSGAAARSDHERTKPGTATAHGRARHVRRGPPHAFYILAVQGRSDGQGLTTGREMNSRRRSRVGAWTRTRQAVDSGDGERILGLNE
jgi:hypothetical protein